MELSSLGGLEVIYEVLLAFISDDIDKGIFKLRILVKDLKMGLLGEGKVGSEEAHI